jgi:hypothetical protein
MGTLVAGSTNLSDAYARQAPTASQRRVFGKLPQLYAEATSRSQRRAALHDAASPAGAGVGR